MLTDTIAAISTPIGEGGIAVVRVSGQKAVEIVDSCFVPKSQHQKLTAVPSHSIVHGHIYSQNGEMIDEVLVAVMRAPRTYSGEDTVEISCHGGILIARLVLETIISYGARLAYPGEFTKRAFLNGKLDLSQAEAVADLIHSKTELALKAARNQLQGGLSKIIDEAWSDLMDICAHVEADIDFSEEDIEIAPWDKIIERLCVLREKIDLLLKTSREGKILREGLRTVIIGSPNSGKSSLLNRLLGQDRAIVSSIPGTTRDTIEELANINGLPVIFVDTAGLRNSTDPLELEGIKRSMRALENAELVLHVIDCSRAETDEDRQWFQVSEKYPRIIVLNKIDLPLNFVFPAQVECIRIVKTSCLTGVGLDELKHLIFESAFSTNCGQASEHVAINTRHQKTLEKAFYAINRAIELLQKGESIEFVAMELRSAANSIGEITGRVYTDDLLDSIFNQFCIGK